MSEWRSSATTRGSRARSRCVSIVTHSIPSSLPRVRDVVLRSLPAKRWFSTDTTDPFDLNLARPVRFFHEGLPLELGEGAGSVLAPESSTTSPIVTFIYRPGGVKGANVYTNFFE